MDSTLCRGTEREEGERGREGGEKFKMLTVRLSFSAGPGPVPGLCLNLVLVRKNCVQNSLLLSLANGATDNGDRRKGKKLKIAL